MDATTGYQIVPVGEAAVTSIRKVDWFSWSGIARAFARIALNPALLRSRDGCGMWYERPEERGQEQE